MCTWLTTSLPARVHTTSSGSKNALIHKYKREGLYFLEQGFHGHAIQSFKRAILEETANQQDERSNSTKATY